MNSKEIKKYKHRAELNLEAFKILAEIKYFSKSGRALIKNNILQLTLNLNDEQSETEEWVGFVQTIKIFIKKHT